MSDDTEKKDEASVDPDFNPDPDTSDVVATEDQTPPQSEDTETEDKHGTLSDRFHAMQARLDTLEQQFGEHVSGLHKHIAKLYEHIRRIGL